MHFNMRHNIVIINIFLMFINKFIVIYDNASGGIFHESPLNRYFDQVRICPPLAPTS